MFDRTEVDGARESRADDERDPFLLGEVTHRSQVQHATGGIHRSLEEDGARLLSHLASPDARLRRIEKGHIDSERRELLDEELLRPAINPGARQQVVTW